MERPTAPPLATRGLSGLSQSSDPNSPLSSISSPAEQRSDAKQNLFRSMRALPTQHVWAVWFDRQPAQGQPQQQQQQQQQQQGGAAAGGGGEYQAQLEQLGEEIESVQDFWRYQNNTPVDRIKMRESIYLFKRGFRPIWEDRRNVLGGSWTFRVPKSSGPEVWKHVQLMAIGEQLQGAIVGKEDTLCGVGLSVRFNAHLISIWHRDASSKASVDNLLQCVLDTLPPNLRPKSDNYFYKRHAEHAGFNPPPELQAVINSQRAREAAAAAKAEAEGKAQQEAAASAEEGSEATEGQ
ncbi:translation initiation factor eIF 4e-like domain-containing protein [Dichotomopilus funicola]|uniref:Translation initiation factor eIF 4e-like domain-containing protein n=1 Tax=Dichotomopilus funicola TaxID=1934379 RepID=A0AAN6VAV4_9PEZI|nr:translation initiation factor eIF 4e-like domain-containing protein [Dichotomopilus funicola]